MATLTIHILWSPPRANTRWAIVFRFETGRFQKSGSEHFKRWIGWREGGRPTDRAVGGTIIRLPCVDPAPLEILPADHRLERARLGRQLEHDVDPIPVVLRVVPLPDHEGHAIDGFRVLCYP